MMILDKIREIETKEISAKIACWSSVAWDADADADAVNYACSVADEWADDWAADAAADAAAEAVDVAAWAAARAARDADAARVDAARAAADWVAARAAETDFYARLASKLKELTAEDFSYRVVCGSRDRFEQLDDQIKIGCISESKTWWLKNYKEVGKANRYTEEQIAEYGNYIKYI